jgi:hypothetical protein
VAGGQLIELGVPSLAPLSQLARDPGAWQALVERLAARPFLHSEGLSTTLGPPQQIGEPLLSRLRELVARFDRFYRGAIATFYRQPERRGEFLLNPRFTAAMLADESDTPLPLSRLDCVLTASGELRVIEINPVGVCTIHLRTAAYLARALRRAGFDEDAAQLDGMLDPLTASFARSLGPRAHEERAPAVGLLFLGNMHRGSRTVFRDAFARAGWRFVNGRASELAIERDGMKLRGEPIDVLWSDFLFYLGYQQARYQQTRFASRAGDFSAAADESARILDDARALELFRRRRPLNFSPMKSYLATSKHLLAWIDQPAIPVDGDRAWLSAHVARTYDVRDRLEGSLSVGDAIRRREQLLVKPCQYGGAHGVEAGRESETAAWAAKLEKIWRDPEWVLQELHEPARVAGGDWLSVGLYNYGGQLGAVTLRTAPTLVVSARRSLFIPVVVPRDQSV